MRAAYLLTAFFVIEGLATIMFALDHKRQLSGRWEWMVASGIVDLALAALVGFRSARNATLDYWPSYQNKYGVRRLGTDRDGDLRA